MISRFIQRLKSMPRDLALFFFISFAVGLAANLVDSTFNNFLNETYTLTGFQRSFLEFPRELPGFMVVFVSAIFWLLGSRKLGFLSLVLYAVGVLLIGVISTTYAVLVSFMFLYSLGMHIFMPVSTTIGMELAAEGRTGRRLGQLNAVRNLAMIVGAGLVYFGFKYLHFTFSLTFILTAIVLTIAAALLLAMSPQKVALSRSFLKLRKEYGIFYLLAVLYGSRKQIFITFAPWVIVTIYHKPTQTIATLLVIGGIIGILFQPLLGRAIDRFGERAVITLESIIFVVVCLGYGFSGSLFAEQTAFIVTCVCYLLDQVLMSVSMARSTYIKKIALQETDIQPALSASLTIDHIFSISVALLGGVIWSRLGYQYVFLLGTLIAAVNFFAARRMRIAARFVDASSAILDSGILK
jgi:predicted MFS family arabinose efflux permease